MYFLAASLFFYEINLSIKFSVFFPLNVKEEFSTILIPNYDMRTKNKTVLIIFQWYESIEFFLFLLFLFIIFSRGIWGSIFSLLFFFFLNI